MWVLEAEGDVLQGKNRPYLLQWQQADFRRKESMATSREEVLIWQN